MKLLELKGYKLFNIYIKYIFSTNRLIVEFIIFYFLYIQENTFYLTVIILYIILILFLLRVK